VVLGVPTDAGHLVVRLFGTVQGEQEQHAQVFVRVLDVAVLAALTLDLQFVLQQLL